MTRRTVLALIPLVALGLAGCRKIPSLTVVNNSVLAVQVGTGPLKANGNGIAFSVEPGQSKTINLGKSPNDMLDVVVVRQGNLFHPTEKVSVSTKWNANNTVTVPANDFDPTTVKTTY